MKFDDRLTGLLICVLGSSAAAYASTFPTPAGQPVGPSLFPMLAGGALACFGILIALAGYRARGAEPWLHLAEWARRPRMLAHATLVLLSLVFYVLVADALGFLLTAFIMLAVLWAAFGTRARVIVPLGVAIVAAIHYVFYTVLHVPLPWGVLQGIAW
jgi:putative tricarboxylic transport membrane protein